MVRLLIILLLCSQYGNAQVSDTTRRGDTIRIETWYPVPVQDTTCQIIDIYMPSFYGGYVKLNDSTTLYKAMFGVLSPLDDNVDLVPRVYRFTYSGYRITLFKTGAWLRQKQINGKWVTIPY